MDLISCSKKKFLIDYSYQKDNFIVKVHQGLQGSYTMLLQQLAHSDRLAKLGG